MLRQATAAAYAPSASAAAEAAAAATASGSFPQYPGSVDPLQLDDLLPDGKQFKQLKDSYEKDEEHGWSYGRHPDVSEEQLSRLKLMLLQQKSVFAYSLRDLPGYNGGEITFELMHGNPIITPPRRYSLLEQQIQDEKCQELLDAGFIELADPHNRYASACTMPAKKDEHGNWVERRFCIDYRQINAACLTQNYCLDTPETMFQRVEGCRFFTALDIRAAFHQARLSGEPGSAGAAAGPRASAKAVTAFYWRKQCWVFNRLPFGWKNSTVVFQRIMDTVLGDAGLTHCAQAFVDDVLIASPDFETHIKDVQAVLAALNAAGLKAHPGKSVFCADKVEYLGHVITPSGIEPQAAKIAAMASLPSPSTVTQLQSVLGLLNYYRCYIQRFSSTAKPLHKLLQKDEPFVWGDKQQQAFDTLKAQLCTEGLALKRADPHRQFIVHTDWSQHGLGAVLAQIDDDGHEYMVACASRSLNVHERNYTPWKGELLAVVWGCKMFRPWIHGRHFEICTDHQPLLWLLQQQNPVGQHARWVLALQEYDFHVRHRPGVTHINADVLSRSPLPSSVDGTGARLDEDSDPLTCPIPMVVFGPVGSGTPKLLPEDQVPRELPPEQQQQRKAVAPKRDAPATRAASGSAVAGPSSLPSPSSPAAAVGPASAAARLGRKKGKKKRNNSPGPPKLSYSAPPAAGLTAVEKQLDQDFAAAVTAVELSQLHVTAAFAQAEYLQRQLICNGPCCLAEFSCHQLDPWELPYSQLQDPLSSQGIWPWALEQQQQLRAKATRWVAAAAQQPPTRSSTSYPRSASRFNISSVSSTFFAAAPAGVVVYEPFGGLCAGLEMVLRNGLPVSQYFYSDIDPLARSVAQHRLSLLQARYPALLPASALQFTFSALPQDVWEVTEQQLAALSARFPRQWLVVGGWECQDLSPAGNCKGLAGPKSSTFAPLVHILAALQRLQKQLPPAYLLENTAMQYNFRKEQIRTGQYRIICMALGEPVCLDAARFDSLAHRVRNYWTNLCTQEQLQSAAQQAQRTPGLSVEAAINPGSGRQPATVQRPDHPVGGRYPVNRPGQPMAAWPTFVAYPGSRAFQQGKQGMVYDPVVGREVEPDAEEREVSMGYLEGDTAAPGVTEQQRRAVLGRCIDANVMQSIMAIAAAWYRQQQWKAGKAHACVACADVQQQQLSHDSCCEHALGAFALMCETEQELQEPHVGQYLATLAVAAVVDAAEKGSPDIWSDESTLYYLRQQQYQPQLTAAERERVRKRAANFRLSADGVLRRKFPDGSSKICPKPEQRQQLIVQHHQRNGHYGVRRTGALVQHTYWWWGLWAEVAKELSKCSLCHRVRSTFNSPRPELQPLPISGLMYRWGVDLCGPFPETSRGNVYCMVAVEHYSKHIELVPLPNKEAKTTAAAFAAAVLGRYGCPAEVLTDQGTEWEEQFQQLLLECMIDHRRTSANHPQADGLAERCVGTIKRALSKLCAEEGSQLEWDRHLPWLMLGYNTSPSKATNLSPYQLMHAVTPTVPPAIRERMQQPVDLDDPELAAADYLARSHLVKERSIIAGDNLKIAQHRDTLRYAKLRSGGYTPQLRRFVPMDFVYVRKQDKEGLDIGARRRILRVAEVRPSGVLILQGRCGTHTAVHCSHCAPCHLPNIDPSLDWSLGKPPAAAVCEQCGDGSEEQQGRLIFCDNCNSGWHLQCCQPELSRVPRGTWVCHKCVQQGITLEAVKAVQQVNDRRAAAQSQPERYTPGELRAKSMHGRLLKKFFPLAGPGQPVRGRGGRGQQQAAGAWYVGKVWFRGPRQSCNLIVCYEDGDVEFTNLRALNKQQVEWLSEDAVSPDGMVFKSAADAEAELLERQRQLTLRTQQQTGSRSECNRHAVAALGVSLTADSTAAASSSTVPAMCSDAVVALSTNRSSAGEQVLARSMQQQSQGSGSSSSSIRNCHAVVAESVSLSAVFTQTAAVQTGSITTSDVVVGTPTIHIQPGAVVDLPPTWQLEQPAGVQAALHLLMPGPLALKDATRMANLIHKAVADSSISSQQQQPGHGFVPTAPEEVQVLLRALDFSGCSVFYDPFAGSGTIAEQFRVQGYTVVQNDISSYWQHPTAVDALQPYTYDWVVPQVIVSSPPFDALDIAAPLMAVKAGAVACIHVPGHWLSSPRVARQRWLQQLAMEGRLHIIMGLPRGAAGRKCAWVLVFAARSIREQLLVHSASYLTFQYAMA